jgi:hypothetical protein
MRNGIGIPVIFALVVALGAVAAGVANLDAGESTAGSEPGIGVEWPMAEQPAAADPDSVDFGEYTPSAHCGLGSGLQQTTVH